MAIKRDQKDERLGLRMSSKLRYGLDLLAERRYRVSESEMICRAVELLLEKEGLLGKGSNSLLELLWSNNEADRVLALWLHAPDDLRSFDDDRAGMLIHAARTAESVDDLKHLLSKSAYELFIDSETFEKDCALAELVAQSNSALQEKFKDSGSFLAWAKDFFKASR